MSEARAGRQTQGRVGTAVNGKWQIDARIGSGGMATVYAATHRNGHRAALKMLHPNLSRDPSTRARFLREGYVANAVGHPGVVAVLDDGVAEDGSAFLVLELLEGETIDARRLRLGGTMPIEEALDLADQALDALAAAHAKGIVHRDVKPENVFLTNEGTIKLLDFGLARMKSFQAEVTKTGVTIGTPEFMPPEQAMGRRDEVDARSDVWALGATLYKAITGHYVHEAQTVHEQLIASATRRSRPIRQLATELSPATAQVIDRSLELEMGDRWQSAKEMQAALRTARATAPAPGYFDDSHTVALPTADALGALDREPMSAPRSRPLPEPNTFDTTVAIVREAPNPFDHGDLDETVASEKMSMGPPPSIRVRDGDLPLPARTTRMSRSPGNSNRPPVPPPPDDHASFGNSNPPPSPRISSRPSSPAMMSSRGAPYPSAAPTYHSRHSTPAPMPNSRRDAQTITTKRPSSARAILFVSLILVVLCATMGAYVLWQASGAPAP